MKANNNKKANPLTMSLMLALIVVVITTALSTCNNKSSAPETTNIVTTTSVDEVAKEIISSTIDEQSFSDDQLLHMNLVYNPYTMEVGDSLIVFPDYAKEREFCTLYLAGVSDPKSIEVEGWFLIEKTVIDSGLIKLLVCNQGIDNTFVSDGKITYDGSKTVYIR